MSLYLSVAAAFGAGLLIGAIFAFFKIPVPAPQTLAGVAGIIGLFAGWTLINYMGWIKWF